MAPGGHFGHSVAVPVPPQEDVPIPVWKPHEEAVEQLCELRLLKCCLGISGDAVGKLLGEGEHLPAAPLLRPGGLVGGEGEVAGNF